jgi:hypothetical protein
MMPDFFAMDSVKITCKGWQDGIGLLANNVVVEVDDARRPVSACIGSLIGPSAIVESFLTQLANDPVPMTLASTQADGRVFADCVPMHGHYTTESIVVGDMHLFGEMCINFATDAVPVRPPFVLTVPADLYVELPAQARRTLANVARMAQQRLLAGKHAAAPPAGGPVETGRGKMWTPNGSADEIRDLARKRGWDDKQLLQVVLDAIDSLELADVGDFILEAIDANTPVPDTTE